MPRASALNLAVAPDPSPAGEGLRPTCFGENKSLTAQRKYYGGYRGQKYSPKIDTFLATSKSAGRFIINGYDCNSFGSHRYSVFIEVDGQSYNLCEEEFGTCELTEKLAPVATLDSASQRYSQADLKYELDIRPKSLNKSVFKFSILGPELQKVLNIPGGGRRDITVSVRVRKGATISTLRQLKVDFLSLHDDEDAQTGAYVIVNYPTNKGTPNKYVKDLNYKAPVFVQAGVPIYIHLAQLIMGMEPGSKGFITTIKYKTPKSSGDFDHYWNRAGNIILTENIEKRLSSSNHLLSLAIQKKANQLHIYAPNGSAALSQIMKNRKTLDESPLDHREELPDSEGDYVNLGHQNWFTGDKGVVMHRKLYIFENTTIRHFPETPQNDIKRKWVTCVTSTNLDPVHNNDMNDMVCIFGIKRIFDEAFRQTWTCGEAEELDIVNGAHFEQIPFSPDCPSFRPWRKDAEILPKQSAYKKPSYDNGQAWISILERPYTTGDTFGLKPTDANIAALDRLKSNYINADGNRVKNEFRSRLNTRSPAFIIKSYDDLTDECELDSRQKCIDYALELREIGKKNNGKTTATATNNYIRKVFRDTYNLSGSVTGHLIIRDDSGHDAFDYFMQKFHDRERVQDGRAKYKYVWKAKYPWVSNMNYYYGGDSVSKYFGPNLFKSKFNINKRFAYHMKWIFVNGAGNNSKFDFVYTGSDNLDSQDNNGVPETMIKIRRFGEGAGQTNTSSIFQQYQDFAQYYKELKEQ